MGITHWMIQTLGWLLLTVGACYMAYQAGRHKECGLWERWYESDQAIKKADAAEKERTRGVTLSTVQFRR